MPPSRLFASLAAVVAALTLGIAIGAQSVTAGPKQRDAAEVARALAVARDADRIPLLVESAQLSGDEPQAVIEFAEEALTLLARFPSRPLEVEALLARSWGSEARGDRPAAMVDARRAESLARAEQRDDLIANACRRVARVQWRQANYAAAFAKAAEARDLLAPHGASRDLALAQNLLGAISQARSDLETALEHYLAALETSRAVGDEITAGLARNNVGIVYWQLGQRDKALAALQRVLADNERLGEQRNIAGTATNVAMVLVELDRAQEALPYLERALAINVESGDTFHQAKVLSNLGYAQVKLGEPEMARSYHERALALRRRIDDKDGIARSSSALAAIEAKHGDPAVAVRMLEQAIDQIADVDSRDLEADLLRSLAKAREAAGDPAGALAAYRRFHELESGLANEKTRKHIAELETRYEAAERERELARIRSLAESRRTLLRWLVAGSLALAVILVLVSALLLSRSRTQRALRESEQRYRMLFQGSAIPKLLIDVATRVVADINAPARELCDRQPVSAGTTVDELEPEWVRVALVGLLEAVDEGRPLAIDDCRVEPSGRLRHAEVRGTPTAVDGRDGLLVTVRDITERREHEEERMRADKMDSLGVLAGGIAHDFNNALTGIIGHIELARSSGAGPGDAMLAKATLAAIGARRLTSQLLAFARGGRPVRRAADVGALLREAVDLAGAGSHMRIDLDVPPDLWLAEVDHGQFGQVVSNLIINAQQATSAGGRLRIRASNFRGDPMTATSGAGQRHVRIDFTDNGVGIPDDVRDHVFDPYFTTKVGGSGLGLATAFAICRNHGGALSFRSRVGAGTEFRAFFPASNATSVPAEPTTAAEPSGEGAILVLEDDAPIRDIYRRMLERWGFRVETVADGEQAVALHSSHLRDNTPFDLVIVDLTIPGGMGGRQALHAMRSQAPGVRAIVASGYSDDPTMANHRAAGFVAALAKPFTRAELAAAVNAAMSADVNGARAAPAPRPGAP